MNDAAGNRRRRRHWLLAILAATAALIVAIILNVSLEIVRDADLQQLHPADAIVVFGAAEYAGRPSPVFKARLDHAYDIFQKGIAPVVITTGGAAEDPTYSEGGVGHDYLLRRGIPENSLIAETQGSDTAQSARRVAVIMNANGMKECVPSAMSITSSVSGSSWNTKASASTSRHVPILAPGRVRSASSPFCAKRSAISFGGLPDKSVLNASLGRIKSMTEFAHHPTFCRRVVMCATWCCPCQEYSARFFSRLSVSPRSGWRKVRFQSSLFMPRSRITQR